MSEIISGRCCAARVCQGDVTGRSLGVVAPGLWPCHTKTSVNNPHITQSLEMTTSRGVWTAPRKVTVSDTIVEAHQCQANEPPRSEFTWIMRQVLCPFIASVVQT